VDEGLIACVGAEAPRDHPETIFTALVVTFGRTWVPGAARRYAEHEARLQSLRASDRVDNRQQCRVAVLEGGVKEVLAMRTECGAGGIAVRNNLRKGGN